MKGRRERKKKGGKGWYDGRKVGKRALSVSVSVREGGKEGWGFLSI